MTALRALAIIAALALATPAGAQEKAVPYWASISSGKAMVRKGPGRNYPGLWLYQRRDLPVRVLKVYDNWRLIEDPDGD
ncbi:MAG: SH3 domain-containing protein, partial [Sphingomicrobium sp.]